MMADDAKDLMRKIAERTVLADMAAPGAVAASDGETVAVKLAANGDLVGVRIAQSAAPGADVRQLAADLMQAWRRAAREVQLNRMHQAATEFEFEPSDALYDAINERFRDRTRTGRPAHADVPTSNKARER